jgi:hypothetical protein
MDIQQARTESTQEEMKARMDIHQEKMEAAIHSIWSELEETIKHRVEDVLSCVDQKTPGLRKELTEKIDETWVALAGLKDIHRYAVKEPPGNRNRHKGAPSQRIPGQDTDNEDPN